jgi:hypothetical protein
VPSGLRIPGTPRRRAGAAAMPRNHPRHGDSHERFQTLCGSSSRLLRIRGPALSLRLAAASPFPKIGTEGHLASTTPALPEGEEGRLRPHLSSCITREHHLASRLNPRRVRIALGRYEASSVQRAARRGLASSPTGARPIVSFRKARVCERRSSGRRRTPRGRPYVAPGTKDTVSLAPACARAGPALHRR